MQYQLQMFGPRRRPDTVRMVLGQLHFTAVDDDDAIEKATSRPTVESKEADYMRLTNAAGELVWESTS